MSAVPVLRSRPAFVVLDAARYWLFVPLLLLFITLGVGLYAVSSPSLTSQELSVDQFVSAHHLAFFDVLAIAIAQALSPAGAIIIVAMVSAVILWRTRSALRAAVFGWTVCVGWLTAGLLKALVSRPRPDPTALVDPLLPEVNNASFPSGHTAFATALVVGLVLFTLTHCGPVRGRRPALLVAVGGTLFIVIVAVSRVYLGVHYPLDVTAGVLAGASGAVLAAGLARMSLPTTSHTPHLSPPGAGPSETRNVAPIELPRSEQADRSDAQPL